MQETGSAQALGPAVVTGAGGFFGSALCRRLESMDVRHLALDSGAGQALDEIRSIRPRVVFHIEGSVDIAEDKPDAASRHNAVMVGGTRAVLKAASEVGVELFILFSSCAVMQQGVDRELDETTHPMPTTAYGRAQLVAEGMVGALDGIQGMRTVSLRPPMVYGPGHRGNLARMISSIERGTFPPLPKLTARRSLVHVEDLVDAALTVARNGGSIARRAYFVSEERPYSADELYDIILAALDRRPPRWRIPLAALKAGAALGDAVAGLGWNRVPLNSELLQRLTRPAIYSSRLIEQELGFRTSRSFETSARELVSSGRS